MWFIIKQENISVNIIDVCFQALILPVRIFMHLHQTMVLTHNETQDVQPDQHPGVGAVIPGHGSVLTRSSLPVLAQRLLGFTDLQVPLHVSNTTTVHCKLLHLS